MAVRLALGLSLAGALIAYAVSRDAAQGFLIGALAGILGFWVVARRLERLANQESGQLRGQAMTWSALRMLLYGLALWRGYTLDTEHLHGFIAAALGLAVIRVVLIFLAFSGLDLSKQVK